MGERDSTHFFKEHQQTPAGNMYRMTWCERTVRKHSRKKRLLLVSVLEKVTCEACRNAYLHDVENKMTASSFETVTGRTVHSVPNQQFITRRTPAAVDTFQLLRKLLP
jgi:CRISPR/Cas system-associated exonuclease Cas4 (RecB family)